MPFNRWLLWADVVHIYNVILLSYQKEQFLNICCNMDDTGGDNAKWNKSSRERQLSYGFTHLWNIRNSRKIGRRRKGRMRGVNRSGNEPWETMDSGKQTEGFRGRGVKDWDRLVMGIKESTYCMVHWVLSQVMNHGTLHQKLGMYCMVTNIT